MKIVAEADGCIATTPEAAEIYQRVRTKRDPVTVTFIPTPYPVEDQRWNFSLPANEQSGIFIGTREWDVPSRNHFAALLVARQLCEAIGEPVSVVDLDGHKGYRLLDELQFPCGKLRLIEKRKSYPDYLRDVARHKIVLQLDRSRVPGQVAGDALLCRIPCVGGDSAIERIAFAKTCGEGRTITEIASMALDLLKTPIHAPRLSPNHRSAHWSTSRFRRHDCNWQNFLRDSKERRLLSRPSDMTAASSRPYTASRDQNRHCVVNFPSI